MYVYMYVCMYVCMYDVRVAGTNRKFVPATLASSSLSCKDIRKVTEEHAELCYRKERVVQGALMRSGAQNHHHIWSSTLVHLPESIFKWCLNSVVDTLPHNSNLMRWNKSADDSYPLYNVHVSRLYPMF